MKQNTETPSPVISNFNYVAGLVANSDKDFHFGGMTDINILERHIRVFGKFIDKLDDISIRGVNQSLMRLVSCYIKHSTDSAEDQNQTIDQIVGRDGIISLYDEIAIYGDKISEWRMLSERIIEVFDKMNNNIDGYER